MAKIPRKAVMCGPRLRKGFKINVLLKGARFLERLIIDRQDNRQDINATADKPNPLSPNPTK